MISGKAREAMEKLLEGNERFRRKTPKEKLEALAKGQHPHAIIVSCSDSRTAPEIVFDAWLGEIFPIRTAGNLVPGKESIATIEYMVAHGTQLLAVVAHTGCGAVTEASREGRKPTKNLDALCAAIKPAVDAARLEGEEGVVDRAALQNAKNVLRGIAKRSKLVREAGMKGELVAAVGMYDLKSGEFKFLAAYDFATGQFEGM